MVADVEVVVWRSLLFSTDAPPPPRRLPRRAVIKTCLHPAASTTRLVVVVFVSTTRKMDGIHTAEGVRQRAAPRAAEPTTAANAGEAADTMQRVRWHWPESQEAKIQFGLNTAMLICALVVAVTLDFLTPNENQIAAPKHIAAANAIAAYWVSRIGCGVILLLAYALSIHALVRMDKVKTVRRNN